MGIGENVGLNRGENVGSSGWNATGDGIAPTVTGFVIPATSDSYAIQITTFTATDAVGVTGYLITESATTPLVGDAGWSGTAQTSYVVSSDATYTLYAWAKDAAGNISTSLNDSCVVVLVTGIEPVGNILFDGFESADLTTTNLDGWAWDNVNATSIVTRDAACSSPGIDTVIFNGANICVEVIPSVRLWTAKDGLNSLRFRYGAGLNWSEQRFFMNNNYPDLWVSYWIKVPINYSRGVGTNNKWFDLLWGATHLDYETDGPRIEMQDWPGTPSTNMDMRIQLRQTAPNGFVNSNNYPDFVTPADAGRWMHCAYQMVSGDGTGAVRLYRMWENESAYTLINEITGAVIKTGANGYTGWGYGYFMGFANAAYTLDTEFLIDNINFGTNDLRIT